MKKSLVLAVLVLTLSSGSVWAYGIHRYMNYWAEEYRQQLISTSVIHVVVPGETIWQIAKQYHPEADPRSVLSYIRWINNLEGPSGPVLTVGQRVLIPRFDP